jgi:TetR/AcrR family transcriptional regulator, transcriptional repressor for nem operon
VLLAGYMGHGVKRADTSRPSTERNADPMIFALHRAAWQVRPVYWDYRYEFSGILDFRRDANRRPNDADDLRPTPSRQSTNGWRISCLQFKDRMVYISTMSNQNPVQLPRGRPRSFDVDAAVKRAMGVFWSRGYHATALPDLLRATKLSRGSLYAAFGDKHSLFLRALDRYVADALTRMDIELDPRREPVDGLRAYLAGYVDRTSGANGRRGCLLVATAMELAGRDAEVDRRIGSFFKAMEARVADVLARAKASGKLANGVEPSDVARILVCFVEGLRVVGKTAPTRITSQATVDALLDRLIR